VLRIELNRSEEDGNVWTGRASLEQLPIGAIYGISVDNRPPQLDPYARACYRVGDQLLGVVTDDSDFDWSGDQSPRRTWGETVIYEAHVKGLTMTHPGIPEAIRGTYAALAHPTMIRHLQSLGITAVELLPSQAFRLADDRLHGLGLANYWGYDTLAFFAPHPLYAATKDPLAVRDEFKATVKALHAAGIEVILDVVYNHSSVFEGLCQSFYRGQSFVNASGCGNTTDANNQVFADLVVESLEHWITEYHVDGFRFDLAPILGMDQFGYNAGHPLLERISELGAQHDTKLIAEPWSCEDYRLGRFPLDWAEWNDQFRDGFRAFWFIGAARAYAGSPDIRLGEVAHHLCGSSGIFEPKGPRSVNFIAAHDGFTLADLTAYDGKRNEANGEGSRDGCNENRSWNHGVEGSTDDPIVLARRRHQMLNLMASMVLSVGIPMIVAGDEFGRSQQGNNNAYCQDNEISWVNWDLEPWQEDMLEATRRLITLRHELGVWERDRFFTGEVHDGDDCEKDVSWRNPDGSKVEEENWHSTQRAMQALYHPVAADHSTPWVLVIINGEITDQEFVLPRSMNLVWNSADSAGNPVANLDHWTAPFLSVQIFVGA
jgi:glycogen operon protein